MKYDILAAVLGAMSSAAMGQPTFKPSVSRAYYPSKNPTGALKIQRAARKLRNRKASK